MTRFCVIDDDNIYRYTLNMFLRFLNKPYSLLEFEFVEDALEYFTTDANNAFQNVDVLMFDLSMPIMDGWEFIDALQLHLQDAASLPRIYMVSSSLNKEDLERAQAHKYITAYLVKPLSSERLNELFLAE